MFRCGIPADTALRLGRWFGASAEFWLNLQKLYELRQVQREIGGGLEKLPRLASLAVSRNRIARRW